MVQASDENQQDMTGMMSMISGMMGGEMDGKGAKGGKGKGNF